jgi:carboxymuconolactone decarboxylase family protein
MQTINDITMVAPALEKYAQAPLADLRKRPGLTPSDRSIVTIAALIARNQTIEMSYYFNFALDNGVKPREISEIIMHQRCLCRSQELGPISFLRFHLRFFRSTRTPRPNAQRTLSSSSATSLRASCSTPLTFYSRPVAASGPCASRSELGDCERADCFRPGCADRVPPQSGDGQRPNPDAGCGGHHAIGLLCWLVECVFRVASCERRLRETFALTGVGSVLLMAVDACRVESSFFRSSCPLCSAPAGSQVVRIPGLQARPLGGGTSIGTGNLLALPPLWPAGRRVLPRLLPPVDGQIE